MYSFQVTWANQSHAVPLAWSFICLSLSYYYQLHLDIPGGRARIHSGYFRAGTDLRLIWLVWGIAASARVVRRRAATPGVYMLGAFFSNRS